MSAFFVIAGAAFRRNLAYFWSHLVTALGSVIFGLIYMALWRAAAAGHSVGRFTPGDLVGYIALGQVVLWTSVFLPRELGVSDQVRSGEVAVEFVRPVSYFMRSIAVGAGSAAYGFVFRGLPLVLAFTVVGAFPWSSVRTPAQALLAFPAIAIAATVGVGLQYLTGVAAFWTTDVRWARRLLQGLTIFCGGQLLPIQLMPPLLRSILVWMPFQSLISLPVSVWLGRASLESWLSALLWFVLILVIGWAATRTAGRRLEVQGG